MSNYVDASRTKTRRPLTFFLLGLLLFATTCFLMYDRLAAHQPITLPPEAYTYNVAQSVQQLVHYQQSSFFGSIPDAINTAYLADITNYIDESLHYTFKGDHTTDLHYSYGAQATLQSTSGSRAANESIANVWTKQYTLLPKTAGTRHAKVLAIDPKVQLPFTQYKQAIDQFKDAFNAPVNSSVVLTFNVQVAGSINGAAFEDDKTSTVTIPLDQQIYRPEVKFIDADTHTVFPPQSLGIEGVVSRYELWLALIIAVLGVCCAIYGLHRQRIKTPHQKQLEKIFRYHDGIIVRASHAVDLADKNVVTVQSFDDLLNLEEEIKAPIIASKVNSRTTHFIITRDDIAYMYTLGEPAPLKASAAHAAHPPAANPTDTTARQTKIKISG